MIGLLNNTYNLDVAKVFGVRSAIFIECLYAEFNYQCRNKLLNSKNTMAISRKEIYEKTALDDSEQQDIEIALSECKVISVKPVQNVPNKNYYIIDGTQLLKIIDSDSPADILEIERASQFIKGKRIEPISKRQSHISQMKKKINVEDPVIQDYFIQWVDAVYANPKGFLSPKSVEIAQQELLSYARDDQAKQINVLTIAIKNGMRDITWAIQRYEESNKSTSRNFAVYNDIKAECLLPSDNKMEVF